MAAKYQRDAEFRPVPWIGLEVLDQRRNVAASREHENRHQRQCVRVAGIPIMNGSNVLEGYVRETIALTTRSTPYSMRKAPAR